MFNINKEIISLYSIPRGNKIYIIHNNTIIGKRRCYNGKLLEIQDFSREDCCIKVDTKNARSSYGDTEILSFVFDELNA